MKDTDLKYIMSAIAQFPRHNIVEFAFCRNELVVSVETSHIATIGHEDVDLCQKAIMKHIGVFSSQGGWVRHERHESFRIMVLYVS
jgi:hypothetical protein